MSKKVKNIENLFSVTLNPSHLEMKIGDTKQIFADFSSDTPDNQKVGDWNYDKKSLIATTETPTLIILTAIKAGKFPVSYVPTYDKTQTLICNVTVVDPDAPVPIKLTPKNVTVIVGDDFFIDVEYDKNKGYPSWVFDTTYFEKINDSTDTRAHFKALVLPKDSEPKTLVCNVGGDYDGVTCNIIKPDVKVKINPSIVSSPKGTDFYVDILYDPYLGNESGYWDFPKDVLSLETDSTPYRAHFTVIEESSTPVVSTWHTSDGSSSASFTCHTTYPSVQIINLSNPVPGTLNFGDEFYVDISYVPDNTFHGCKFNDAPNLVYLADKSTPERAYFKTKPVGDGPSYNPTQPSIMVTAVSLDGKVSSNTVRASGILPKATGLKFPDQKHTIKVQGDISTSSYNKNNVKFDYVLIPEYSYLPDGHWQSSSDVAKHNGSSNTDLTLKFFGTTKPYSPVTVSYVCPPTSAANFNSDVLIINCTSTPMTGISLDPAKVSDMSPNERRYVTVNYTPVDCVYDYTIPIMTDNFVKMRGQLIEVICPDEKFIAVPVVFGVIQQDEPDQTRFPPYARFQ
ncbi:hypothetical protein FOI42_RS03790 [Escherichia coli]|nr:hypothetical protein [Escherichia coli]